MRIRDWSSDVCSSDLPPTKTLLNLGGKGAVDQQSHRPVPKRKVARITLAADPESLPQQIGGKFALLFHGFQDARAQHFEQTWDDDHDSRAHFLDIGCQLFEALGIIALRAKSDGDNLPDREHVVTGKRG